MRIELIQGDITQVQADIIVNAANSSLLGGGGVDGAIHRAGGKEILSECREIRTQRGKCPTGGAVMTTAGNLPAKFVIHTVGPVWNGGNQGEPELLRLCYLNSLALAEQRQLTSIAFPNISTGIYNYPKDLAAQIAINTVREWRGMHVNRLIFVCFDKENLDIYQSIL